MPRSSSGTTRNTCITSKWLRRAAMIAALAPVAGMLSMALAGDPPAAPVSAQMASAQDAGSITFPALSAPSALNKVQFEAPGIVKSVAVKEGDTVKKGQELMAQDDKEELL